MGLANQLGVSYQAVSNWDRGESMPDISKLPELAEIFHISVDELLNGKAPLVEAVLNDAVDEYMKEGTVTEQELADTLPLLKPEQAEEILEKTDVSSFTDLSVFLPYMEEDDIAELAIQAMQNGILLQDCHEFMSEEAVGELAMLALEKGFPVNEFLDYVNEEDAGKLAIRAMEKGILLEGCLDYMNEEDVAKLALKALKLRKMNK